MTKNYVLLATLVVFAAGCTRSPGPAAPPPEESYPVTTHRREYRVQPGYTRGFDGKLFRSHREVRVVATYINRTGRTVFPAPCGFVPPDVELQKWVDGRWERAYEPACVIPRPCGLPALAAGASRTDTIVFRDYGRNAYPRFLVDSVPGMYRVTLRIYSYYGGCDDGSFRGDTLLPVEQGRSNSFRIRGSTE